MSRPRIPKEKEEKVVEMLLAGATPYRIQKELGVVKSTITRIMWEHGMQSKPAKGDEKYNQAKKELKFSKNLLNDWDWTTTMLLKLLKGGENGNNHRNCDILRGDGRSSSVAAEPAGTSEGPAGRSGADGILGSMEEKT
jgi:hypothetical protein